MRERIFGSLFRMVRICIRVGLFTGSHDMARFTSFINTGGYFWRKEEESGREEG